MNKEEKTKLVISLLSGLLSNPELINLKALQEPDVLNSISSAALFIVNGVEAAIKGEEKPEKEAKTPNLQDLLIDVGSYCFSEGYDFYKKYGETKLSDFASARANCALDAISFFNKISKKEN